MDDIIANEEPVIIASNLTKDNLLSGVAGNGLTGEGYTVFGDELGMLLEAGYTMVTVDEAGEILLVLILL